METKMKNLRKLAGISIFLILFFMVIALFQFRTGEGTDQEDMDLMPDQVEYMFNEGWTFAAFSGAELSKARQESAGGKLDLLSVKDMMAKAEFQEIRLPYVGKSRSGEVMVFKNTLPKEFAGLTLGFSTQNSNVYVFLDGELIYQHIEKDMKARNNSDNNFVTLPYVIQNGNILIAVVPSDTGAMAALGNMKIETHDKVVVKIVGNNIADIACCLLIILMAIVMFTLAIIRRYTSQPARGELFLGLVGLTAGVYGVIVTDTLSVFYNVQKTYEIQGYLVLLIPIFLTFYFEKNFHTVYPRRFSLLIWCVSANAVAQILLQILHVKNLKEMIYISAAVLSVVCAAAIVSLIQYDYKHKSYQTLPSVLAMLVLLSGNIAHVIIDAVSEYTGDTASNYSMAVFAVIMAVMHTFQISKEHQVKALEIARLFEEKVNDAEAARQEALAANEAKGKFLAHMSHEIRTPINAVLGMNEMILRESKEQNIKEYAVDISMAGQTLLSLVNDILDFSKIESGKKEIVPVEYGVSSLIHDLANIASQRAKKKQIRFEVEAGHEIPSALYGDDMCIRQIVTNLLTNAVKYTQEGSVWLKVHSRKTGKTATLMFEVEDTGIGIKEEDLPRLFEEFERFDEEKTRNIEGTGLGMNITIRLLELLGSSLHVESVYGKGSKFYFELEQQIIDETPIGDFEDRARQMAENYDYSAAFCAPDAQILVVDDNAVNRKVLRSLLKETQIQITDVESGAKCLELVQKNRYDLIFLDHMMPEMDGVETLHHIKGLSDYPCQNTPIVVLTANAVSGAKEKYLSEGFDDFLSKPIVPEKLEQMIQKMLPEGLLKDPPASEAASQTNINLPDAFLDSLPQVDGLDWQYAWMHLPDSELLEYTVKEFYAQIDPAANHLERAYGQITEPEQLGLYRIQAHAMKSLAATVGILPLSGIAKLLEYAARDGRMDVITSVTTVFLEEWRSYRQKLQGVFGIGTVAKKEAADYSILQALVEMLRISMQDMDIDKADEYMNQLREYAYPEEMEQNIQALAESVTNLDAEETDRIAELLIRQMEI